MKQKTAKLIVTIYHRTLLTLGIAAICGAMIALLITNWKPTLCIFTIVFSILAITEFYEYCKRKSKE